MNKNKLGGHKHDVMWWLVPMKEEPGIENEFHDIWKYRFPYVYAVACFIILDVKWSYMTLGWQGGFYWHGLTSIQAMVSNKIAIKVWGEIAYSFPNFNSSTIEIEIWTFHSVEITSCDPHLYLAMYKWGPTGSSTQYV